MHGQTPPPVAPRLQGKTFALGGKFSDEVSSRLAAFIQFHQGTIVSTLDRSVDFLVLGEISPRAALHNQAARLIAQGAPLQILDLTALARLAEPTREELLACLLANDLRAWSVFRKLKPYGYKMAQEYVFRGEDFSGLILKDEGFGGDARFEDCSFRGARIDNTVISDATRCDFSESRSDSILLQNTLGCRFQRVQYKKAHFLGDLSYSDFTEAAVSNASFSGTDGGARDARQVEGVRFFASRLGKARFDGYRFRGGDFRGVDLSEAKFFHCSFDRADFRGAILRKTLLLDCDLEGCDLRESDLSGAILRGANLQGAQLHGANLDRADLRSARLDGVDLAGTRNRGRCKLAAASTNGPALAELDAIAAQAKELSLSILVSDHRRDTAMISTRRSIKPGEWIVDLGHYAAIWRGPYYSAPTLSEVLLTAARVSGYPPVEFELATVTALKSPLRGEKLQELVLRAIAEAFLQELPSAEELAARRQAWEKNEEAKRAALESELDIWRRRLDESDRLYQEEKVRARQAELKRIQEEVEKAAGKVQDLASFVRALEVRLEKKRLKPPLTMLRATGFQLYHETSSAHVAGVVKSQSEPNRIYACRLESDGAYACCTQNLRKCGGLRDAPCKHLLVLLIGLVQAGSLDPSVIDGWVAETHGLLPAIDRETMSEVFLKYKGAEAGEIDWRPAETAPEDYYMV